MTSETYRVKFHFTWVPLAYRSIIGILSWIFARSISLSSLCEPPSVKCSLTHAFLSFSLSLSLIHRIKVHTTWEHSQIHSWFSFISTLASLFVCVMHCISLSAALPSEGHLSEAIHLIFNVRASGAICNLNVRGFWSLLLSIIFSCTK